MCSCDDFQADFQSFSRVRARKAHRCAECGETIKPGEIYERIAIGFDGHVDSYRQCIACERLRHAYGLLLTEDCNPPFGEVRECVREMIGNDPPTIEREVVAAFLTPSKWEWLHIEHEQKRGAAA